MATDPILAEIVRHGLQAVAEEMGAALARTAHSVNIRDRKDFSCGVFDAAGRLVAQAEHIPVHLGLLAGVVERTRAAMDEEIPAGTMIVVNDPWISGSHLPDVVVLAPVDRDGVRLGYVADMAHQVDVGGLAPGSLALGASEVFQEGMRLSPLVLARDGAIDPAILRLFRISSRTPDMVEGDLLAQVAATATGIRRLSELAGRLGVERLAAASADLLDATDRRLGARIAALPPGWVAFEDTLEWQEAGEARDLVIRAAIEVRDERLHVDFAGTAAQVAGPVNAVRPLTMSCVLYAVKTMLDPELPSNAGLLGRIVLSTPPDSLVDAAFPAAVALCTSITSQRICDVLIGAFDRLLPEGRMAASTGSMNALIIGGTVPATGARYSYVETYGGGQGAVEGTDGADGTHTHMTNTANSPVEAIERAYPFTVGHYGLLPGTGGAGRWRGGLGMTRELRLEAPATVTVHLDRTRHRPWGVEGGGDGSFAEALVEIDGETRALPGKCTVTLPEGAVIRLRTAGGGGFGDPAGRDPTARAADRADGLA